MYIAEILNFNVTNAVWPWLFPSTYLIHITEEYWGGEGFSAHIAKTRGVEFTTPRFLFMTGLGCLLMVAGIVLAWRLNFPQLLLVILGAVVFANGLSHTVSGVLTARYNPGLLTGILIWVPLGAVTLAQLKGRMSGGRYLTGLAVGIGIQVVVSLLSSSGSRSKLNPKP